MQIIEPSVEIIHEHDPFILLSRVEKIRLIRIFATGSTDLLLSKMKMGIPPVMSEPGEICLSPFVAIQEGLLTAWQNPLSNFRRIYLVNLCR